MPLINADALEPADSSRRRVRSSRRRPWRRQREVECPGARTCNWKTGGKARCRRRSEKGIHKYDIHLKDLEFCELSLFHTYLPGFGEFFPPFLVDFRGGFEFEGREPDVETGQGNGGEHRLINQHLVIRRKINKWINQTKSRQSFKCMHNNGTFFKSWGSAVPGKSRLNNCMAL